MIDYTNREFIPFIGLGDIKFGVSRELIRNNINLSFKEFKRNEFSENTTDYFEEIQLFIEFDIDNKCNAIELQKNNQLYFNGTNLFEVSYQDLLKKYKQISLNYEEDDGGVIFYDIGFGVSIIDKKIETIIIFPKNYWE